MAGATAHDNGAIRPRTGLRGIPGEIRDHVVAAVPGLAFQ